MRSGRSIKCEYRERRFPSCRHTHLRRRRSIVERGWQLAPSRRQRLALSPHIRPPRPPLSFLNFIPPAVPAAPPLPTRALPVTTHHVRPRGLLVVVLSLMRSSAGPQISPMPPRRRPRRSSPHSYSTWPCSVSSSVSSPSSVLSFPQSTNQEPTYPLRGEFLPGLAICGGCVEWRVLWVAWSGSGAATVGREGPPWATADGRPQSCPAWPSRPSHDRVTCCARASFPDSRLHPLFHAIVRVRSSSGRPRTCGRDADRALRNGSIRQRSCSMYSHWTRKT